MVASAKSKTWLLRILCLSLNYSAGMLDVSVSVQIKEELRWIEVMGKENCWSPLADCIIRFFTFLFMLKDFHICSASSGSNLINDLFGPN